MTQHILPSWRIIRFTSKTTERGTRAMKNNGSLGYLTREGMRNLYVNRLMSMASVSVLFSCMVMIGVAFMIMVNINMFIGNVEDQNVIMVFVDDSATKAEEDELGASLQRAFKCPRMHFRRQGQRLCPAQERDGGQLRALRRARRKPASRCI